VIAVVDYGAGNLRSVLKTLERLGADAALADAPSGVARADRIIMPGVGAFPAGMNGLRDRGLVDALLEAASNGKRLLGICLGMQLLFESSEEMGVTKGLGLLPGRVRRMNAKGLRIPHMGWNQLEKRRDHPLLRGVDEGAFVYFVHSYAVADDASDVVAAVTDYGGPFASVVGRGGVCGLQFHPEKSQTVGLTMLKNFLEW
jgi:glutamine amidotransferase